MRNYLQILIVIVFSSYSVAVPVYNDLWDVSNGITITASSEIYSGAYDMFGASNNLEEAGNLLFANSANCTGIHWIRWETPEVVSLSNFKLYASADADNQRSFSYFGLFVQNEEGGYDMFFGADVLVPYYEQYDEENLVSAWAFEEPVIGKVFGAAFLQSGSLGPRIIELDGFGVNHAPEPAMIALIAAGVVFCRLFAK